MKAADWSEIDRILQGALELDGEPRRRWIDDECAGRPDLREEIESLLAADDEAEAQDLWRSAALGFATPRLEGDDFQDSPLPSALQVGDTLDGYRLLEELGVGGSGRVFAARREDPDSPVVALKAIDTGERSRLIESRFLAERRILGRLTHPFVARLLDGGRTPDGRLYFVMDKVDGVPIDRYCTDNALGLRSRLQLMVQVCDAVSYAHRHLVVHRDLKPANLMITADGEPRLLDFGIAKLLDPDAFSGEDRLETESPHRRTLTGFQPMTPAFAAPEQMLGEDITTATDVYTLGLMLYELVTGVRPHDLRNLSPLERRRRVCEEPVVAPSRRLSEGTGSRKRPPDLGRARIDAELDAVLLKSLARDATDRYPSATELAADLRRFLADEPVAALKATPATARRLELRRLFRRHKKSMIAATFFGLAVLGFGVSLIVQTALLISETRVIERERLMTTAASQFVLDLLAQTRPPSPGQGLGVEEWIDSGAYRLRAGYLQDNPRVRARLLHTLARVAFSHGHTDKAKALALDSLNILRSVDGLQKEELSSLTADLHQFQSAGGTSDFATAEDPSL